MSVPRQSPLVCSTSGFGSTVEQKNKYTKKFLKVIVHVIIIDQLNQTACLYEIQVTVIYSQAILGAMASKCHKEGNL